MRVYVYDDPERMRREAAAFNGDPSNLDPEVQGVTHAWTDDDGRAALVTVRLHRGHLDLETVAHEMHHASTALYGATLPGQVNTREVLSHVNEPAAYLHGQLVSRLVDRLVALGYYAQGG